MSENPYETPASSTVDLQARAAEPWSRAMARFSGQAVVLVAFTAGGLSSLALLAEGRLGLAVACALLLSMAVPLFQRASWKKRLLACLWVPVAFLGFILAGAVGVTVYFSLFYFSWFEAVFNDKGGGPLGLLLFFSGFALGLPALGWWSVERTRQWWRRRHGEHWEAASPAETLGNRERARQALEP